MNADVVVVGGGLAGLVAAAEISDAGRRVVIVDQEPEASLGGQAFWSFGGLFLVDSPEQRRLGDEDEWPRKWAEAYVDFAAGEKRRWLHDQGLRFFPVVAWAERGGSLATGHGNSCRASRDMGHRTRRRRAVRAARACRRRGRKDHAAVPRCAMTSVCSVSAAVHPRQAGGSLRRVVLNAVLAANH